VRVFDADGVDRCRVQLGERISIPTTLVAVAVMPSVLSLWIGWAARASDLTVQAGRM